MASKVTSSHQIIAFWTKMCKWLDVASSSFRSWQINKLFDTHEAFFGSEKIIRLLILEYGSRNKFSLPFKILTKELFLPTNYEALVLFARVIFYICCLCWIIIVK